MWHVGTTGSTHPPRPGAATNAHVSTLASCSMRAAQRDTRRAEARRVRRLRAAQGSSRRGSPALTGRRAAAAGSEARCGGAAPLARELLWARAWQVSAASARLCTLRRQGGVPRGSPGGSPLSLSSSSPSPPSAHSLEATLGRREGGRDA